jgi:hypothetical protein
VIVHETCSWADRRGFLRDNCGIEPFLVPIDRARLCKYDVENMARRKSIIYVIYVISTSTNDVLCDGEARQVTIIPLVLYPRQLDLARLVSLMRFLTKWSLLRDN